MRSYTIAGQPMTVERRSFSCSDRISARTTCSFVVIEPSIEIEIGMEVIVRDEGKRIFAGTIDTADSYGDIEKYVAVSCVDYSQLMDKRLINDAFENTKAGDIVRAFISKVFTEEGITEGIIEDAMVISKATYPYVRGDEAMNELCEVTGLNWGVDKEKRLNFFSRHTYSAPFALTDTSRNYSGLKVSLTRSQYRNRQYIQAGLDTTQEIVKERPSPKPDGVSKTFLTRLPVAKKPRIFIDNIEVGQEQIGVNGLDKGRRFYFSFNSNTITQDAADPVLSDTTKLEISYFGLYPILAIAESPSEIGARQAVEGGSGIHEDIASDRTISSRQSAIDLAQGKLDKYGIVPTTITFSTYQHGLESGQLLPITNTKHSVSGSYLIESVTIRDDGGLTRYDVKCLDGSSFGGWEKLFRSMLDGSKQLTIRENEVIVMLTALSERQNWSETNHLTVFACHLPSEDLYPGEDVIPC